MHLVNLNRRHGLALGLAPLLMGGSASAQAAVLRLGFTASWALPWGEVVDGDVRSGIHHDIGQALARRLGMQLVFSRVPQQREIAPSSSDHARQHSDLGCGMHPSWFPNAAHYHWSPPLFDMSDVLVGLRGMPAPRELADLPPGVRVGTVRGYRYPALQAGFDSGRWLRDDAPDQAAALRKLSRRRTTVAVVSMHALDWYLRQHPESPLSAWRLTVQEAQYHCAIPKGAPLDPRRTWDALEAMKREGELARILAAYRPR